jgi:hypothetical protein
MVVGRRGNMKRYIVACSESFEGLEREVARLANLGYEPAGGVSQTTRVYSQFIQAMWFSSGKPYSKRYESSYDQKQAMLMEECAGEPY